MRNKSLFLIIACVCGAVAAVGASQLIQGQGPATGQTSEILVAARTIEVGELLTAEMLTLEPWPADRLPGGAINDLALIEGKAAAQQVFAGEPILDVKLIDEAELSNSNIPDGYIVVSMRSDSGNSIAPMIRPGDRVNVNAFFAQGPKMPQSTVRSVLLGVRVFAVDGATSRLMVKSDDSRSSSGPESVSLLIQKSDNEAWMYATELGKITLSLSGPEFASDSEEAKNSGSDFMRWYREIFTRPETRPTTAASPPKQVGGGFKMLKLHGGNWTEYEIPDSTGNPFVKASSDPEIKAGGVGTTDPSGNDPSPFFDDVDDDFAPMAD
jgi:pilus assembly protein CpaB